MPRHFHTISQADAETMAATRTFLKSMPGLALAPETRPFFDDMIAQTPLADGVDYEADTVGGVPGWWCRPKNTPTHGVILYLHGGGYVMGSAEAYRHPVGQIAAKAKVSAFALDYALAPERPFPAAFDEALAAYDALVSRGYTRIAIAGDSAGGGLTLALAAFVSTYREVKPSALVAISPWVDMTASGESFVSRAAVDPMLDRGKIIACANAYLAGAAPEDPRASPVFGNFSGLPPILIHVGDDEVLLDDSVRFAEQVERAGGVADLHVWEGMLHVFTSSIATLEAAREAMGGIGSFLASALRER
ncbi:alpha/beta hydrolase [Aquisediminimonas profunda]|uniref:alpha/beta hydrolase n=1 Tax=Aquisediminimonas profunda TaxID=1550733 RepID=UPI001C63216D|nr:alpha/beta hydrolase [Aquisediminimonas profunda]